MNTLSRRDLAGIVLAGGRSSRFGRDKLIEPIDGQPLLWRPVRAVAAVADEVVVVLAPTADVPPLPADIAARIAFARDAEPFGGPLSGVVAGLGRASAGRVLVVAGDQPGLRPELLSLLSARLDAPGLARTVDVSAAALIDPSARLRPLPCVVVRESALEAATRLLASGERRLGSLIAELHTIGIPESDWAEADPRAEWTRDIDIPADLEPGG